jgi:hypothetical protein
VADYDTAIPPGGEGRITLKVNTKGYDGWISKRAQVLTNDPRRKIMKLTLKAFVKIVIQLSPRYVYLKGKPGQTVTKAVEISTRLDKPLRIETGRFTLDSQVSYHVEEIDRGKRYRIHFTNVPGPSASFRGLLEITTNYPERPKIRIPIRGRFVS